MTNEEFARGLREFADAVEACETGLGLSQVNVNAWVDNAPAMAQAARDFGGAFDKVSQGNYYILRRDFGAVQFDIFSHHALICERVVRTETVEIPDPEAKITVEIADPDAPLVTVEREVVEWVCPESILSAVK